MQILILEDDPNRHELFKRKLIGHGLTIAETAAQAIVMLQAYQFDLIFLDHDLGGETFVSENNKNTGSEVVRWMLENCITKAPIVIHSMNDPAASSMMNKLNAGFFSCYRIPFSALISRLDDPSFITQ